MRSKRPGWAAAGRRSSLISALSGRRRFPVDFDELDETFDAEVGERHDAVVAEPLDPDHPVFRLHFKGDVVEPVDVFAEFLCDARSMVLTRETLLTCMVRPPEPEWPEQAAASSTAATHPADAPGWAAMRERTSVSQ